LEPDAIYAVFVSVRADMRGIHIDLRGLIDTVISIGMCSYAPCQRPLLARHRGSSVLPRLVPP
jgi:hypothetical protein